MSAAALFEEVEEVEGFEAKKQALEYYRGVAEFFVGQTYGAEVQFEKSLWLSQDRGLDGSSKDFIVKMCVVFDYLFMDPTPLLGFGDPSS